jgi:hypothetical protein
MGPQNIAQFLNKAQNVPCIEKSFLIQNMSGSALFAVYLQFCHPRIHLKNSLFHKRDYQ